MLADDTALFLKGTPANLQRAFEVIEKFCAASGAKLKWDKSFAVWASNEPRSWNWGEELGLQWVAEGETVRYLGFPFGANLAQKDLDGKVLLQIRNKLNAWGGKRLSLAARVLVANQVVLASIWYLASCSNVSKNTLLKVRTQIRNFIWSGSADHKARARVAWDSAIIPTIKGGLKVFDPYAQTRALLAKMIPRALTPGPEPWKAFIRHRISQLAMRRDGDWGRSEDWLLSAPKVVPQGSALWQVTWSAWTAVRKGISKQAPTTQAERLRQSLFLNPILKERNGRPLGISRPSRFQNWTKKGILSVQQIWDSPAATFISDADLQLVTRSHRIHELTSVIREACTVALDLTSPTPLMMGAWLATEEAPDPRFYHLTMQLERRWWARSFTLDSSGCLRPCSRVCEALPIIPLTEARIVDMDNAGKVLGYNPEKYDADSILRPFGSGRIKDLRFDPKEWDWRPQGTMAPAIFFDYSTKRGYRIIVRDQHKPLRLDTWLAGADYSPQQRKQFFQRLWHSWIPRKVSGMVWLTIAGGLPLGSWRIRMGHSGICPLCNNNQIQTPEHALYSCPLVTPAWERLRHLRAMAARQPSFNNWQSALLGDLGPPTSNATPGTDKSWDPGRQSSSDVETPWHVIRSGLLWSIWVQICDHDMGSGFFHLGVALYRSWKLTVEVGMGAWRELQKFKKKRDPGKHHTLEQRFLTIWSQGHLFCEAKSGRPSWHPTPHPEYLAEEFSRRLSSTRIERHQGDNTAPQHSESARGSSGISLAPPPRDWTAPVAPMAAREPARQPALQDEADRLAEEILEQMMSNIMRDADAEFISSLPGDLQDPSDLQTQAAFWTS